MLGASTLALCWDIVHLYSVICSSVAATLHLVGRSSVATDSAAAALPHFVEYLVTRAVGTEGFATGGLMRSPPGDTASWGSHGVTIMAQMRALARSSGLMSCGIGELVAQLERATPSRR